MAILGLCCCVQAFSSFRDWGHSLAVVHGLLTVVASLVAEHGLWGAWASVSFGTGALSSFGSQALEHRLNSCGAQA